MELYTVIERQAKFIGLSQVKHILSHVFFTSKALQNCFSIESFSSESFWTFQVAKSYVKIQFQN